MEKFEKHRMLLDKIKWLGLALGCLMYWLTYDAFGMIPSIILGVCFAVFFFLICEKEKNTPLANYIMNDLSQALRELGQEEFVFELKGGRIGFIIRIYLIRSVVETIRCNNAVVERIRKSEYRPYIWITQIVEVDSEEEIREARKALNEDLLEDTKNKSEEYKRKNLEQDKALEQIANGEQFSDMQANDIKAGREINSVGKDINKGKDRRSSENNSNEKAED